MEKKQSIIIPMLTLRGMTVFPNMIVRTGKSPCGGQCGRG